MGVVLDTSALITWERTPGHALPSFGEEPTALPAIVWAEALIGARMADSALRAAQRRARLEVLRRVVEVHPFTTEVAEHYADIYAELAKAGAMIPQNDIAVAATARNLGFAVLVGPKDERHFNKVPGLEIRVLPL